MAAEHPILPRAATSPHTAGSRPGYLYFNTTDRHIYWDNGFLWIDIGDTLTYQERKFNFTAAQVLTFSNATGPDFLPAVTGYTYMIQGGVMAKRAGPVFTGTQAVQVKYRNTPLTPALTLNVTNVWDQTTEATTVSQHPATGTFSTDGNANSIGSKGLMMSTNGGAAFGGTGSDISILLRYSLWPATLALMDAYPLTALP